jgi:hypothetical protein
MIDISAARQMRWTEESLTNSGFCVHEMLLRQIMIAW